MLRKYVNIETGCICICVMWASQYKQPSAQMFVLFSKRILILGGGDERLHLNLWISDFFMSEKTRLLKIDIWQ